MRGLLLFFCLYLVMWGITPAHAGTIKSVQDPEGLYEDHPRACGDYCYSISARISFTGSPPRMRGLYLFKLRLCGLFRITPAHAGTM